MKLKLRAEAKQDAKLEMLGVCLCGDDGGSAPPPAPTSQTVTQTTIPEWARPYAEQVMGQAQALTNLSMNPYKAYGGQRIADFTGLQNQAFQGAQAMGPDPINAQVANKAMGMGAAYDPYKTGQFTGDVAQQYMNPYVQNVMDIEKREAARQSAIQGTQQQAQATQAGAFGGSRDAIMRAERERNLATQMGDIQSRGMQQAFGQGQQQFNTEQQLREQSRQYGAGLGLQGLQTALAGSAQGFQQGMDANKLQQLYGTQQQQRQQDILSQQYQDFLNQQNYPYKQLGFFSDIVRGTGQLSTQGSSSVYQAPPSLTSQLTGLGTAALGLSGGAKALMSAKGGHVKKEKKKAGLADLAVARMQS